MNRKHILKCITCVALPLALIPRHTGEETTAPKPVEDSEPVLELSPFVVSSDEDEGYSARYTLAGTRIRTDIKDVGSSITIVTSKMLMDTGTTNAQQLLVYTPNTEVSAPSGNFLGIGDNPKAGAVNYGTTRVRGLTSADNTRDFFLSDIPWDSYNTGRIDIQRGPNSILFGIGSPAGIINYSLNHASFKNSYKLENRVDNFNSVRFTGDFNQVLVDNELAIRVSFLNDNTKFEQKPSFRKDKRFYAALRWDPAFLNRGSMKSSLEINGEVGEIRQNLPRQSPPNDYLTPWFLLPDDRQATGFRFSDGALGNDNNPAGYYLQGAGGILNSGGTIATYYQGQYTGLSFPHNQVGNAFFRGIADVGTVTNYKSKGVILGALINAWKSTTISDRSIFDYQKILLDGNTKAEDNDFETFNAVFRQEFKDGMFGYELAYDYQQAKPTGHSFLGGAGYGIVVDVMGTIAGTANGLASEIEVPNPNLGKPFVIGGTNSTWNWQELTKRTARFTGFYNLDFNKLLAKDSKLAWVLGENRFTGLASRYESDTFQYFSGSDYKLNEPGRSQLGGTLYVLDYLSQTKLVGHNPANINLQGIQDYPVLSNGTRVTRNSTAVPYSTIPYTPYTEWQLPKESRTYTGSPTLNRKTVDTAALVWQGYWFGGSVIPMVAFRRDEAWENDGGYYNPDGSFHYGAPSTVYKDLNNANVTTYKPFGNYYFGPDGDKTRVESKTYSVVTHLPKSWRAKLPGNADFQLIYNQSENFQPAPGRTDILNRPLPDPSGRTKEYGAAVSLFNDKVYLKVVKYKTEQKDVEISQFAASDGATVGAIGETEVWARSAAKIHSGSAYGAVGPAINNTSWGFIANTIYGYSSDGHPVTFKPYGPWAQSLGPDVIGTSLPTVWTGQSNGYAIWNGGNEPYAPGTTRVAYTQAELDATWAIQKASMEAILNNPPPDAFLEAMGISKTFFMDPQDANYFPGYSHTPSGAITGTTVSEGTEFELVAQPIKGLSISLNASKTRARRTSLAQSFVDFIAERRVFYQNGPAGDMRLWSSGWADTSIDPYNDAGNGNASVAFENHVNSPVAKFLAATNSDVPELRPWSFNGIANYQFYSGPAKGVNVGGGVRWQDSLVTGYPIKHDPNGFEVYDLDNPHKGDAETAIDFWIGYERQFKTSRRGLKWRVQLNVRNVFAKNDLIVASTQPDGSPAAYRIPEPRTISLTNTLEF